MAESSSIKQAQAIKLCELCLEDSIKCRCIDCNKSLCAKCKLTHFRIPSTAEHQIITLGPLLQNVRNKTEVVIDNIPCKNHPKKIAGFFCRTCDSLNCQKCVSSGHKKHNFVQIESALDEKMSYLRHIQDKIDNNLNDCELKISEIQGIKSRYNAPFDESLRKIKQKEQELIASIHKYSKELQEKVQNERSQVNKILSKIKRDVESTKKNLEDQRHEINATLNSKQGSVIFKASMRMKYPKFDFPPYQVRQFIPETESAKRIQVLFGSLQQMPIPTAHGPPDMDLKVISTFTSDLPYIETLATLDGTSAWISCYDKHVIRNVNIQNNNMKTSEEIYMEVYNMVVTANRELLLIMASRSDVKLRKRSGEMVSLIKVAPLLPCGIHVTKDNDVIVCVRDTANSQNVYALTDQSDRAIIIFNMNGKQKQKYQYDKNGKRLFTVPISTTTNNKNQDILVVDRTSDCTGRVVVLNKGGNLRWFYKGHSKINVRPFDPRNIVTTMTGHFIVSDYLSHALHVLHVSEDGDVLTYKVMKDMGILYPSGLDIDNGGMLWLGCGTGGEDTGAKLHIIKLV